MNQLCTHFGICGGCKTQDIAYEQELDNKWLFVKSLYPHAHVEPILPCDSPWEYRNKMEFSFSQSKMGDRFLGLMQRRGKVVNLQMCLLCTPWFISVLQTVKSWWDATQLEAYFPPKNRGVLRNLTLREGKRTHEKMVVLTTSQESISQELLEQLRDKLLGVVPLDSIILRKQILVKGEPTRFEETTLFGKDHIHEEMTINGITHRFKIRASSFFQPNPLQAEKLIAKALFLADLQEDATLFDLYCGTATIGIFASQSVKEVHGIELNQDAIDDATYNLKINNISNLKLIHGDCASVIPLNLRPDCVIVDPPRCGLLPKTVQHLKALGPRVIVYISCNPQSQAEDIKSLLDEYCITAIQPVDQFPRTPHIENIVALRRHF